MHETLIALAGSYPNIYYAAPLIVMISLVYGATRHEHLAEIIEHSIRSLVWVLCFMGVILAVIWLAGFFN
jgi:hypothetical protein